MQKQKQKNYCSEKSLIRLCVVDNANNIKYWYSFLHHDDKLSLQENLYGMVDRILVNKYNSRFNKAIFYNNQNRTKILKEFESKGGKIKSKMKVVVYDLNNNKKNFYSKLHEENDRYDAMIGPLMARIIGQEYSFQFKTAIFYDQHIGNQEVVKMTPQRTFYSEAYYQGR